MKHLFLLAFLLLATSALANENVVVVGPAVKVNGASRTSGTYAIAAGARKVEFMFSSDFAGTITGTSGAISYSGSGDTYKKYADDAGGVLPALTLVVSAGTARVLEYR